MPFVRIRTRSVRFRITALFVAWFGLTLIGFSIFLHQAFIDTYEAEFDADLFNHAVDVGQSVSIDLFGDLNVKQDIISGRGKIFPFPIGQSLIQIRTFDSPAPPDHPNDANSLVKSMALGEQNLPIRPQNLRDLETTGVSFSTIPLKITDRTRTYRVIHYLVSRPRLEKLILQIAVPITLVEREKVRIFRFFLFSIPLMLLVATLGGFYLSRKAFNPVREMIQRARGISPSRLSQRIPIPNTRDELFELATTLNGLLDRLERAFQVQDQFISDASHQLKTPLAILKGELDVMSRKDRSIEELQSFLASAQQETDEMIRLVENLLVLARVTADDSQGSAQSDGAQPLGIVRLDEIVIDVVSRLEKLATQKQIRLKLNLEGEHFTVRGDQYLLSNLFQNLIENAIKFSPREKSIDIQVIQCLQSIQIRVRDQGPGVPPELQERIFDRFFRVNNGTSPSVRYSVSSSVEPSTVLTAGTGLGLSIAKKIVEFHFGQIRLRNVDPGALFEVELPVGALSSGAERPVSGSVST